MQKEATATGKSVEEAIEKAKRELDVTTEEIGFEIIGLPKRGFLGFGKAPAKVRIYFVDDEVPEKPADTKRDMPEKKAYAGGPDRKREVAAHLKKTVDTPQDLRKMPEVSNKSGVVLSDRAITAVRYVEDVLRQMKVKDAKVTAAESRESIDLLLEGEGLGVIIGRRGETLDAVQYLTSLVVNRMEGEYIRVSIDSGDYRKKRAETLERLAYKIARSAVKTGRPTKLEPMNPYERRIIHAAVSKVDGATSSSIGEEPNRRVVISPKGARRRPEGVVSAQRYEDRPIRPRSVQPAQTEGQKAALPLKDAEIEIPKELSPEEFAMPAPASVKQREPRVLTEEEKKALPLYGKMDV